MKVAVTYELSDTQRVAVGAITRGVLEPASRAEIRDYAQRIVENELATITNKLEDAQQRLVGELGLDAPREIPEES